MDGVKRIRSSLRQILVSLLLVYVSALLLATDGCTRAARASIPAHYGSVAVHSAATAWLPVQYQAPLNQWQATLQREAHAIFDSEWVSGVFRCAK